MKSDVIIEVKIPVCNYRDRLAHSSVSSDTSNPVHHAVRYRRLSQNSITTPRGREDGNCGPVDLCSPLRGGGYVSLINTLV